MPDPPTQALRHGVYWPTLAHMLAHVPACLHLQAEQIMKIKASMVDEYAMMTGQTRERIEADLDRDNYMTAEQAKAYGLVDQVVDRIGVKGAVSEFS